MHKNLTYFIYIANPNPNPAGPSTPQYGNYPLDFNLNFNLNFKKQFLSYSFIINFWDIFHTRAYWVVLV